jgi:hypothetical protein
VYGHPTRYTGRGRYPAGHPIATHIGSHGYWETTLHRDRKPYRRTVHTLVCRTFHGPPPTPEHEVGHHDSDRTNCRAANLYWTTRAGNHRHAYAAGRQIAGAAGQLGTANRAAKLNPDKVRAIRRALAAGVLAKQLAREYGVTPRAIYVIRDRITWSHVPEESTP